uniref:Cytochrome c oxidase subunit 2 n=1 Tax=Lens contradens TaxID=2771348 RepID=A0A8A3WK72_9BIVA|nr:cytochrome c oxidase subunit 2 [Lens contradens]
MCYWGQMGLQEATSVLGVELVCLYDYMMLILVLIFSFVGWILFKVGVSKVFGRFYLENNHLEIVWTLLPFVLLFCLGLPSIKLLYLMDDAGLPETTIKVVGHQWYWSYEYVDMRGSSYSYDSYMLNESMLEEDSYRLFEVDNRCVAPRMVKMRGLVTSSDVIHSWAIPSSGVKVDSVPGRVNQVGLCFLRAGVYYGQCSELCGVNHSFMPICVECVSVNAYSKWILSNHDYMLSQNSVGYGACAVIFHVICKIASWVVYGVKLYLLYLYYLFYYMLYIPSKYVVVSSWGGLTWVVKSSVALMKWLWWFSNSPVEALVFAVCYLAGVIWKTVVFVVTSPVKVFLMVVKGVCIGIVGVFKLAHSVLEAVAHSMSSFTNDEFHEYVMKEVNYNTKKLIWNLCEHYRSR